MGMGEARKREVCTRLPWERVLRGYTLTILVSWIAEDTLEIRI